ATPRASIGSLWITSSPVDNRPFVPRLCYTDRLLVAQQGDTDHAGASVGGDGRANLRNEQPANATGEPASELVTQRLGLLRHRQMLHRDVHIGASGFGGGEIG